MLHSAGGWVLLLCWSAQSVAALRGKAPPTLSALQFGWPSSSVAAELLAYIIQWGVWEAALGHVSVMLLMGNQWCWLLLWYVWLVLVYITSHYACHSAASHVDQQNNQIRQPRDGRSLGTAEGAHASCGASAAVRVQQYSLLFAAIVALPCLAACSPFVKYS
jgi:hypothetical protein